MKKGLKIGLIVGGSLLVVGGAWAGLTKTGVIPNWFEIEALCSGNEKYEDEINGISEEKYRNFSDEEECGKILKIKGYSQQNYDERADKKNKNKEVVLGHNFMGFVNGYQIDGFYTLSDMPDYEEWLDDNFAKYKKQIIKCENNRYENYNKYYEEREKWASKQKPVWKPIIYIYPTTKIQVNVKLGTPENLSYTYPKYNGEKGRNVIANPNGDLEDMDTGRKLYALYREGKNEISTNFDEGFVVKGEDIILFLEEKLAILGLNEREAEEFIVYWLPQMEDNAYNLIRFETKAEQDENMSLNITPNPDTVIRVMMDWKAIDEPIDIPEQQLETPERTGFTVVEWGGSPRN